METEIEWSFWSRFVVQTYLENLYKLTIFLHSIFIPIFYWPQIYMKLWVYMAGTRDLPWMHPIPNSSLNAIVMPSKHPSRLSDQVIFLRRLAEVSCCSGMLCYRFLAAKLVAVRPVHNFRASTSGNLQILSSFKNNVLHLFSSKIVLQILSGLMSFEIHPTRVLNCLKLTDLVILRL